VPKVNASSAARTVVTLVMDVLVAVVVVSLAHLVAGFFGSVASSQWGKGLLGVSGLFVLPLGIAPIPTPYAGVFDVNAAATVMALLGVEWMLGLVRRNA
jgi:putative copper export protein